LRLQSILFHGSADEYPLLVADLWEFNTLGIVQEADSFRAFFESETGVANILAVYRSLVVQTRAESVLLSEDFSRDGWDPIFVGERFVVAPSWVEIPVSDRIRLTVDPTSAFGTGRHESTQLAMRALERHIVPGMVVLDVGCGSGILSAAAIALGARTVIACDVHPEAAIAANRYLRSPVFLGAVDAVRNSCADLVVANISRSVLDALAADLNRVAKPAGLLVLGGFLKEKPPSSFVPVEVTELDEWICWVCRPTAAFGQMTNQQHRVRHDAEHWW
jgi:ribosomal protein L11 methyltransferase